MFVVYCSTPGKSQEPDHHAENAPHRPALSHKSSGRFLCRIYRTSIMYHDASSLRRYIRRLLPPPLQYFFSFKKATKATAASRSKEQEKPKGNAPRKEDFPYVYLSSDWISRSGSAIGSLSWVKRNRPITSPLLDSKLLHMGSPNRPAIKILYQGLWRPASRTRTPVSRGLVLPQRTRRPDAHRGWQGGGDFSRNF